jgi:hypothetical protein
MRNRVDSDERRSIPEQPPQPGQRLVKESDPTPNRESSPAFNQEENSNQQANSSEPPHSSSLTPTSQPPTRSLLKQSRLTRSQFARYCVRFHHPLLWVGLVWGVAMTLGTIAAIEIVRIDPADYPVNQTVTGSTPALPSAQSEEESPAAVSPEAEPPPRSRLATREETNLPFLTLGFVAISCAAASFVLAHRSKPQDMNRRSSSKARRLPRQLPVKSKLRPKIKSGSTPEDPSSTFHAAVTVMPPNQPHPLDWKEASVADHLDLRQRRPLSYWL